MIPDVDVVVAINIDGSKLHPPPTRSADVGYDELQAPAAFVRTKVYGNDHIHE